MTLLGCPPFHTRDSLGWFLFSGVAAAPTNVVWQGLWRLFKVFQQLFKKLGVDFLGLQGIPKQPFRIPVALGLGCLDHFRIAFL